MKEIENISGETPKFIGIGSLVPLVKSMKGSKKNGIESFIYALITLRKLLPHSFIHAFGIGGTMAYLGILGGIDSYDSNGWIQKAAYGVIQLPGVSDRFLKKENHKRPNIINGRKQNISYLPLLEENNFEPLLPDEKLDIIYLCSPNNPTGQVFSKKTLKNWVDYAKKNNSLIIFDGAYEAFISSKDSVKSIYEITGAKDVAIEMRSFSKKAGFTSLRCSYLVIPKNIKTLDNLSINSLWNRYIDTKFGGISYLIQKAAEATYSDPGKAQINSIISTYMQNTKTLLFGLKKLNYTVYGGIDSPYVWCKCPKNVKSMDFFDKLLEKNICAIPGIGFGSSGEGFVRF
ncbi:hypothetical protein LCGC14_3085950, partial [marine sediment metagenome]